MSFVSRKLLFLRNLLSRRKPEPDDIIEEKWLADFSKPQQARFEIKAESSYDANLRKNLFSSGYSLVLALKKTGCIAWTEAPEWRYRDLVISGAIRIDTRGGYGAGGVLFRMVDSETYYSFLISNRAYFRLDAVRNGTPFPLIGWTEMPHSSGAELGLDQTVDFSLVVYGNHIVVLIKGRWAAEINDSSILEGTICLAAASYESGDPAYRVIREVDNVSHATEVFLESLSVDSRIGEVSSLYEKWNDSPAVGAKARFNLAETFAAMDQYNAAMAQLRKIWILPEHRKTQAELLLAGKLSRLLDNLPDAESYTSQCFEADIESREGKEALVEMATILNAGERFKELKDFCDEALKIKSGDPLLWNFLGHAYWNLNKNKKAAASYDQAFMLDKENGNFAKNAADAYDAMDRKKEALKRYIEAGRAFLRSSSYSDISPLVPKLLSLGEINWEARSLAGKWAFAVEDWKMAEEEFSRAEELRSAKRPRPPKDGAQIFLMALLSIRAGKRRDALPLLKEATLLEKDYALFHFRLAENLFLLEDDPDNSEMLKELDAALALIQKEIQDVKASGKETEDLAGWIYNFAAQVALRKGNLDEAAMHLGKARNTLGDLPEVLINQAVLAYLRSSVDEAIEVLSREKLNDSEGIVANCAGNLLVRSHRFDEANEWYRRALDCQPDNVEYLCNRATCLMELSLYGEADELLNRASAKEPSPALLEMISYVAVKMGEYPRAEKVCRSALEMDPCHAPSLLSLGWVLITLGKKNEAREIIERLDEIALNDTTAKSREELRLRLDELLFMTIGCASCERSWKVPRESPSVPAIRLFATPPDELPAGSCPDCGKTYCIGCAKENLDSSGRFICPVCKRSLKLANEGLKKIIHDWSVKEGLIKPRKNAVSTIRKGKKPKK